MWQWNSIRRIPLSLMSIDGLGMVSVQRARGDHCRPSLGSSTSEVIAMSMWKPSSLEPTTMRSKFSVPTSAAACARTTR
ncbi:uncharacterized protein IUM83_11157 [Phytophthora cinnamomi]|uniref:uncharacterized protein n=1 Tax=Phytophthora cinnamomi TaxID=4785 RepID=UPI003559A90D|nr:hypothetical protein IUM83_11157 [Phytophthora cinnamomi]